MIENIKCAAMVVLTNISPSFSASSWDFHLQNKQKKYFNVFNRPRGCPKDQLFVLKIDKDYSLKFNNGDILY